MVVVAYFDRLVRKPQGAGSKCSSASSEPAAPLLAVDAGEVRADTASRWLSSTMLGMVAEYHRRVTAERTSEAKRRAIADGAWPAFPNIPPGLCVSARTASSNRTRSKRARFVTRSALRASGASVSEVSR